MRIFDTVQIVADNTDVWAGRLGADVPTWARVGRIWLIAPDSDWLMDLSVGGKELARSCGPAIQAADNLQSVEFSQPHFEFDAPRGGVQFEILMNVDVVTAGVGSATIQWEG